MAEKNWISAFGAWRYVTEYRSPELGRALKFDIALQEKSAELFPVRPCVFFSRDADRRPQSVNASGSKSRSSRGGATISTLSTFYLIGSNPNLRLSVDGNLLEAISSFYSISAQGAL